MYARLGFATHFDDVSRRPFIFDSINALGSTGGWGLVNSLIHGNSEKLNLLVTDGSVVPFSLPVSLWSRAPQLTWFSYLESALD